MYKLLYGLTCDPFSKEISVQRLCRSADFKQFIFGIVPEGYTAIWMTCLHWNLNASITEIDDC